ncbi:amidohydrolase family protein [Aureimonas psammosilenae]|uniref:amidohydrolase family protein n=1 Tax=Aureimonas psammosilenae TaxID=2495496 RepID=UPI00186A3436|nr:amidohydrolase family protein [Aureimonas psammosilenae]
MERGSAVAVDAHQHFWMPARGDYGWLNDEVAPLVRDFMPKDLAPILQRNGIGRTVLVQAAETEGETEFLLGIAERTDFVAGVVGWLDMEGEQFPERLAKSRENPWFVGLRPMLQSLPEDYILRPRVLENLRRVAETGLAFDILTFPRHLPFVLKALEKVPELRAVLDHLSKPDIAAGTLDPWREHIAALARFPNLSCKVSGMVTEAGPGWTRETLRPYVDHVAACFGEERLIFGSDWPVATLAASYDDVVEAARELLGRHFGPGGMEKVFGGNAARFYRLAS